MKSADHPNASQGHSVTTKKGAGRKTKVHSVSMERADNGGYSMHVQRKFDDGKPQGMGEYPESSTHVYSDFKTAHDALPEIFGEKHPDTTPAKGADAELPED